MNSVLSIAASQVDGECLGHGADSTVHSVAWNGKPAAIKIITGNNVHKEIQNNLYIRQIKSSAPARIAPYLPDIYEAETTQLHDKECGIIVMERLNSLSEAAKSILFGELCERSDAEQLKALSDYEFVTRMITSIICQDMPQSTPADADELISLFNAATRDHICCRPLSDYYDGNISEKITNAVKRNCKQINRIASNADLCAIANKIQTRIAEAKQIPFNAKSVPLSGGGGEGVRCALRWLLSNGIEWDDLHDGNLLARDDGHLVLVDFGFYNIK